MDAFTPRDYDLGQEYRQRQLKTADRLRLARIQRDNTNMVIPLHAALELCREIRHQRMRWLITPAALRCRGCLLHAEHGVPARLAGQPGCTGCPSVTASYRHRLA